MKLSRRELASALAVGAALGQTPGKPRPTPEAELQEARDDLKARVAALARYEVPNDTEPAFAFRA